MKMRAANRVLTAVALMVFGSIKAWAELEVSATVQIHAKAEFEAPLAPYGTWVTVGSYGRCWRPAGVRVEWRPYCSGEWVWTDCGWYWRSDESWGWACYHYGAWVYDPAYGWVWVPGIDWAPAWVSWRVGGGFVGWAPLEPTGFFGARAPGADRFVFVSTVRFGEPVRPSSVVIKDARVFKQTSAIGGVRRQNVSLSGAGSQRVMFNDGPGTDLIQKASGKPVRRTSIAEAVRQNRYASNPKTSGGESKRDGRDRVVHAPDDHRDRDDSGRDQGGRDSGGSWFSSGAGRGNAGGAHGKGHR